MFVPEAYCFSNSDILCAQRSSPSAPPNEIMIAITYFVAGVTIVRSESLVGLPCGPSASQNTGNSFQIQIVFPDPLVRLPSPTRAKHNIALHVRQVIQPHRQPALDAHQVDHIHHIINPRQPLPGDHPPQAAPPPTHDTSPDPSPAPCTPPASPKSPPTPAPPSAPPISKCSLRKHAKLAGPILPASPRVDTSAVTHANATRGHFALNSASIFTVVIGHVPALSISCKAFLLPFTLAHSAKTITDSSLSAQTCFTRRCSRRLLIRSQIQIGFVGVALRIPSDRRNAMVGPCGLEPQTSSVSRTRSNQLRLVAQLVRALP